MKYIVRALPLSVLALGMFSALPTLARDITATWTPPTEFEDDSPLDPATDLSEYRFYCGPTQVATETAPTATTSTFQIGPEPCDLSATAVAVWGAESRMSNTVFLEGLAPKPPTLISAIIAWIKSIFALWA